MDRLRMMSLGQPFFSVVLLTTILFFAGIILLPALSPTHAEDRMASGADAENPAVTHNTWTSGAAMPTAIWEPAGVAVLKNEIYVLGGNTGVNSLISDTQIYNPATNTWSTGVPLPSPLDAGSAAVVKNILYVIGGYNGTTETNQVWAYNSKTKTWATKSPMPTTRCCAGIAVEKNIIYVIGGGNSSGSLATVESYDPATDTWTEEAALPDVTNTPAVGAVGAAIVTSGGYTGGSSFTGDTETYNTSENAWTSRNPDPTARNAACAGGSGADFYIAGGSSGGGALGLNEAFKPSKDTWTTLASMTQPAMFSGHTVNKGLLYCFGGTLTFQGTVINDVQIFQP